MGPMQNDEETEFIKTTNQQIKFKESMELNEEILNVSQNERIQIKVNDISQFDDKKESVDDKNDAVVENKNNQNDTNLVIEEDNSDIEEVDEVQHFQFDDDDKKEEQTENVKQKQIKIENKPKEKKKLSKFEKKMKLFYKVKDLRERSFLIMCDENKMIDSVEKCL